MKVFFDQSPWVRAPQSSVGLCAHHLWNSILEKVGLGASEWELEAVSRVRVPHSPTRYLLPGRSIRRMGHWEKFNGKEGVLLHSLDGITPRFRKGKRLLTIHDCWTLWENEWQSPDFRVKKAPKLDRSIKRADFIVTPTEHVRSQLVERYPDFKERSAVIPWGPMLPIYESSSGEKKASLKDNIQKEAPVARYLAKQRPFFLCVANFENRKNHSLLFRAMQSVPEMDLVCVANPGYGYEQVKAHFDEAAQEAGAFILFQALSQESLSELYKRAVGVVLPSFDEGFGLPACEAIYHNKPMLLSQIPPLYEVAGEAALYFDPHHGEEDLRGYLKALSEDSALQSRLAQKCETRKHLFEWSRVAQMYMSIYRKLT